MDKAYGRRPVYAQKKLRRGRALLLLLLLGAFIYVAYQGGSFAYYLFFSKIDPAGVTWPLNKAADAALLDKRMNILVLGLDEQEGSAARRSDSMLLVSFDLEKKGVSVMAIPRDTRAAIAGRQEPEKINHAYAYGGAKLSRQAVADLLSIPVNNHMTLDAGAVARLVDMLGGVGLYVENDMKYDDPYQNLHIDIKKGYQRLSGEQSLKYVRFRSDELGDIGRVLRQQIFLKALVGEIFSLGGILKAPYLKEVLSSGISADITPPQAVSALRCFRWYGTDEVVFEMLPGSFLTIEDSSYWISEPQQIAAVLAKLGITQMK